MLNYIRADYKRILTRVPRVVFLILFEIILGGRGKGHGGSYF